MPEPVQVITAGGAAKKKRQRRRRKTNTKKAEAKQKRPDDPLTESVLLPLEGSTTPQTPSFSSNEKQKQIQSDENADDENELDVVEKALNDDKKLASPPTNQPPAETSTQHEQHIASAEKQQPTKSIDQLYGKVSQQERRDSHEDSPFARNLWLLICFLGIMFSFVCYGLLLEYATSGGRKLHELSFLFVTSSLYTITAAAGRYVRDETPTTIPKSRFAVLGLTSMGSTFCSVRSLRYVIYPIQVLAKSCKPVPVMLMGALMGKKYPMKKYINVCLIVLGVALFTGGGGSKKSSAEDVVDSTMEAMGIALLFLSLCFDGGTGAYEDKLMAVHSVGPFDLMYNIQLGKTILSGVSLLVLNQVHVFLQMCQDMGFLLVALGLSGALGQVFIFVTIAKFGALTCSIIGLARKVTTLVASILFYGHSLNSVQVAGLMIAITAMVLNFWGKKSGHGHHGPPLAPLPAGVDRSEMAKILQDPHEEDGDIEMHPVDPSAARLESR